MPGGQSQLRRGCGPRLAALQGAPLGGCVSNVTLLDTPPTHTHRSTVSLLCLSRPAVLEREGMPGLREGRQWWAPLQYFSF